MSATKTEDRHYWHIVIAKRMGNLIVRLLGGTDGPDLTDSNIGTSIKPTLVTSQAAGFP